MLSCGLCVIRAEPGAHLRCAMCSRYCFLSLVFMVLTGCGTKHVISPTPPPPAVKVTIAVTPSSVEPGQAATLTWTAAYADSCSASGDWNGSQPANGSLNVILSNAKGLSYSLACTGAGGSATQIAKLSAAAGPGGCEVSPAARSGRERRFLRHRASSQRTSGK